MDLKKVNFVLLLCVFVLLVFLFFPFSEGFTGRAYADVSGLNPVCTFHNVVDGINLNFSSSRCCLELLKQLRCESFDGNIVCQIFEDSFYIVNRDQYDFCVKSGYDLPRLKKVI